MPHTSGQQPSFIPREMPSMGSAIGARHSGLMDLLALIAIVLVVASGALAVGVFLYQQFLQSSAASKLDQLNHAKAAFEPSLIEQLTRLDDRMHAAGDIMQSHLAPSAFFHMLEQTTITTVAFQTLDFEATDPQHMTMTMQGVADSVNSIALEADLLAKSSVVTSPIFSNINRSADGVHFSLSGLINPASINFAQLVASAGQAQSASPAQPAGDTSPFVGVPNTQTDQTPSGGAPAGSPSAPQSAPAQ